MNSSERHETSVTALDRLVPAPRLVEIDRLDLEAAPAKVWEYVRHGNLARSPVIRALFAVRTMGRTKASLRVDDLTSSPEKPGFQVLVDEPLHELAVGAIGRVWELEIPFVHVATAGEFAAFDQPGFAKVAWAIRLSPRDGGTHLELEVRVDTTDGESWPKFHRYFILVGIGSRFIRRLLLAAIARDFGTLQASEEDRSLPGDELLADAAGGRMARDDWRDVMAGVEGAALMAFALLTPFLRNRRSHWGVDAEIAERWYPGDDLVAAPRWSWTHGVEIDAPAAEVWRWVAQLGAGRGGFYSYQWLENIAGCEVRNAETIHPEWEVRAGDQLVLHPDVALPIVACEPGRWFVAHATTEAAPRSAGRHWMTASWLLHLEPLGEDRCRLLSRYRADSSDDLASRLSFGPTLVEPVGFAMDRRMLLGVKERAERATVPARQVS
ncbi:MAG TPA: hypothetical protein VN999_19185 [Thermoanaerobaculia bacterium]|nr:hypothetical protein [Thermoanaerobaculia bacterium]